ncbi:PREDICTED: probable pectinesterase/pectinesterase inhibitor 7 [Nicotiana attenuata]|uniref:probable pectinesterase/pectinesterase inhibitor 7 n=1 Tax=Nicotiana attenuata TaxID=49451 RepID=UPI0009057022|nr:PREDICTED: probable pectinesterase/pectinesterase inhibitor 7 [Nicotiana attenuata]
MANNSKLFLAHYVTLSCILMLLIMILFSQSSAVDVPTNSSVSPSTICKSTPYPSFCRSVLPTTGNIDANVYDYGRFSVRKSLSSARKFLSLIHKYLGKSKHLTTTAVGALEDCQFLAALNMDYLSTSFRTVNGTSKILPNLEADDVQTMLSAILTNTQTCLDGLEATSSAWSLRNGLVTPLSNDTKLYSVSLALFTKGWVPKKKKGSKTHPSQKQLAFQNGHLPLKMSAQNQAILETVSRRKLLQQQDDDDQVLVRDVVIVNQDGSGNFSTITDAVVAAPNNSISTSGYFLIYITAGIYEEYVSIAKNKKYLMMIGDGINQTIITGNHSFVDGWTTFNSSTFSVVGLGFVAVNITFRNTAGAIKHQAVAVRNGADLSTFYSCSFEGYQDTLYVHSLRQFYRECDIYGTVDFIFGNAAAVFQNCNLYPRLPLGNQFNAITAQGRTDPNQNTGISIHNCTIKAADDLAFSNSSTRTYLGRPWKEYSRTIYMQSFIDGFVHQLGWREWSGDFALNTSYYGEFNNSGPGSDSAGRVTWPGVHIINATDAANFTVSGFLLGDDWLPRTGVPYFNTLL